MMLDVIICALVLLVVVMIVVICNLCQSLKEKQNDIERMQTAYLAITHKLRRVREVMDSVR